MTVSWAWYLEAYTGGAWVDWTPDVCKRDTDTVATRGIRGSGITDRVASPGTLATTWDNSEGNSGHKLGYYSPDHANVRSGFVRELPMRIKVVYGATTKYLWHGWLDTIEPAPGQYSTRRTVTQAVDYFAKLAEHNINLIPVQTSKRPDQLISTVLANMATAPAHTSLATDTLTFSQAFNSEQSEKTVAMALLQKICQSSGGYFYPIGDSDAGETLVYDHRFSRSARALSATLTNTMSGIKVRRSGDRLKDKIIIVIHPSQVDTGANTVLCTSVREIALEPGAANAQTIYLVFRDPSSRASRVSAKDLVIPLVADTDYKMSSISGNSGNDINADLSITASDGGDRVKLVLQNNGSSTGYINLLQARGNGIYLYDPVQIEKSTGTGEKVITIDMYYQDNYYTGKDFSIAYHGQVSADVSDITGLQFFADASDTLMGYALNCDIGSRVAIGETVTGVDLEFFINQVTYRFLRDGRLGVDWVLEPAANTQFFVLNDTSYGILDDTSIKLGYG